MKTVGLRDMVDPAMLWMEPSGQGEIPDRR